MVTKITLGRYTRCSNAFFEWVVTEGKRLPSVTVAFDDVIAEDVEYMWEDGGSQADTRYTIAGLEYFVKGLKRQLNLSWSLMKAWKMHELPSRAPPVLVLFLHAIAGWFLRNGLPEAAIATYLIFHSLVRLAEVFGLKAADISFDTLLGSAVCDIGYTKGSRRRGVRDTAQVDVAWLVRALRVL